jgi:hypothetical protein
MPLLTPAWKEPQVPVRDVIIHTNHNTFAFPSSKTLEANPLPPDPFKLRLKLSFTWSSGGQLSSSNVVCRS